MTIKPQRWYPDTCQCIIIEDYNTVTDSFALNTYENVCNPHSIIADANTRYSIMKGDNQRKNQILGKALEQFTALQGTDPETGAIVLKNGVKFNYAFSGTGDARIITVSFVGVTLTTNQKNTLQSIADSLFGSGKVVVT